MKQVMYTDAHGQIQTRPITAAYVKDYFKRINDKRVRHGLTRGEVCERCGVTTRPILGKNPLNHQRLAGGIKQWKNKFFLCESCISDKSSGKRETVPDIEDLERFSITLF